MLHPFNSRVEVNMIRNAAYSRFKPIPPVDVIINERTSRCRHIVNLLDLSEAISSLNLSQRLIHFENMSFAEQVSSMRSTRVLISIHGAGLSNIIFLQPGSTLIELMHPLLRAPFYRFLSFYSSLNYILIRDVKSLSDSCSIQRTAWSPYIQPNLIVNVTTILTTITNLFSVSSNERMLTVSDGSDVNCSHQQVTQIIWIGFNSVVIRVNQRLYLHEDIRWK